MREEELEIARAELHAVHAVAAEGEYRDELAHALAAVEGGDVAERDAETLERVLELALQTGRIRALYGPGGEQAALRLYRRLPHGSELGASAKAVTEALSSFSGRTLDSIRVEAVGPGAFSLSLSVDGADVAVRLDRQGARVTSVGA